MLKFRIIERRTTAHIAPPLRKPWTDQDRAALVRKLRGLGFTVTVLTPTRLAVHETAATPDLETLT